MILILFLWKVKVYHHFNETLIIIVLEGKYNINHFSIKIYFLNHKKKKKAEDIFLIILSFPVFTAGKLLESYVYIWANNFC